MKTIRVGSRDSKLAVIQSEIIIEAIKKSAPDTDIQLVTMKTTGDIIVDRTLSKIGGKGLFVKELDIALASNVVDITVHSSKDLPMDIDDDLPIVAISEREDARDVLVLPKGTNKLDELGAIGCSSARRAIQLKNLFPDIRVEPVRGNVQTRLRKLDSGEFSALILAAAGLKRLGLEERINRYFEPSEMLPSAGQGILAVQARKGEDVSFLKQFHDEDTALRLDGERAFVRVLGGGCSSPVAAYAVIDGDSITISGMDVTDDGTTIKMSISGRKKDAINLGEILAREIRGRNK